MSHGDYTYSQVSVWQALFCGTEVNTIDSLSSEGLCMQWMGGGWGETDDRKEHINKIMSRCDKCGVSSQSSSHKGYRCFRQRRQPVLCKGPGAGHIDHVQESKVGVAGAQEREGTLERIK